MSGIVGSKFNHRGSGTVAKAGTDGQHLLSSGAGKKHIFETVAASTYDDNKVQNNIAMLGFKVATADSLAKYDLVDQMIDEYVDATGIDAGASTNEILTSGYYSGVTSTTSTNYFGDDSDGALSTSGNVTLTVQNKNGSYDGDMVVKDYTNLTINAGHTLTVDQPCRGMMIFVSGDCVINGTLSMTNKGALANPTASGGSDSNAVDSNGLRLCFQTAGGSTSFTNADTNFNGCGTAARTAIGNFGNPSSNGDTITVVRAGGAGGSQSSGSSSNAGGTVANGTGGGGSGWCDGSGSTGGAGAAGTCFAGGSGGGGGSGNSSGAGGAGTANGGAGGAGSSAHNAWVGGGAGNPAGTSAYTGSYSGGTVAAGEGLGGLLYLIVKGDLTIGASGSIEAKGGKGGAMTNGSGASYGGAFASGGGGGGGGRTIVAYAGTLSNSGSISAAGTASGNITDGSTSGPGGTGGAGVSSTLQIVAPSTTYNNLTLQSTDTTASAQPDNADLIILIENAAGTATINTDIKGYVSRDSGSNFTEGTLVDEGSWGTNKKVLAFHDLDISGQPSGTSMCYKITTHNQAVGKQTRIHATSLGWK